MIVHPGLTNDVGSLTAVEAPVRRPDNTRNIRFTVAAFRPWRGSPASIASDPTLNAALQFACPHRRRAREFRPAVAGCWCREPLPPRLARPKLSSKNWSRWSGLNRRPTVYETVALPAELHRPACFSARNYALSAYDGKPIFAGYRAWRSRMRRTSSMVSGWSWQEWLNRTTYSDSTPSRCALW